MSNTLKHMNQVRIIGGSCRGRKIRFAAAEGLRPTADMVREKIFNWLGQDLTGLTVLDLFAGSGALGLEAASRNAKRVVMVEKNARSAKFLKQNTQEFGLGNNVTVVVQDANLYLKQNNAKFDVVFLDPPFIWQDWQTLFAVLQKCLSEKAKIYVESAQLPVFPEWLEKLREGKSGKSRFVVLAFDATVAEMDE